MTAIDTADYVHHTPSGEDWIVAYVHGDRLAWCGWPEGEANLADCVLIKKASPEARITLLKEMVGGVGPMARHAFAELAAMGVKP